MRRRHGLPLRRAGRGLRVAPRTRGDKLFRWHSKDHAERYESWKFAIHCSPSSIGFDIDDRKSLRRIRMATMVGPMVVFLFALITSLSAFQLARILWDLISGAELLSSNPRWGEFRDQVRGESTLLVWGLAFSLILLWITLGLRRGIQGPGSRVAIEVERILRLMSTWDPPDPHFAQCGSECDICKPAGSQKRKVERALRVNAWRLRNRLEKYSESRHGRRLSRRAASVASAVYWYADKPWDVRRASVTREILGLVLRYVLLEERTPEPHVLVPSVYEVVRPSKSNFFRTLDYKKILGRSAAGLVAIAASLSIEYVLGVL